MPVLKPTYQKQCHPCEGVGGPLSAQEALERIKDLPGWKLNDNGTKISREFVIKDFMEAIDFIGKVAYTAEKENHHPDIHLTRYRHLAIELSTHAIGGLSENDFILANLIDQLPVKLKK